jgi:hypothetical protein
MTGTGQKPIMMLWCTEVYEGRGVPWFLDHQAARTDSGRPRSSMRLRMLTAMRVSVSCAGRLWERKAGLFSSALIERAIAQSGSIWWVGSRRKSLSLGENM